MSEVDDLSYTPMGLADYTLRSLAEAIKKDPRICEEGGSGIFIRSSWWRWAFPQEHTWNEY